MNRDLDYNFGCVNEYIVIPYFLPGFPTLRYCRRRQCIRFEEALRRLVGQNRGGIYRRTIIRFQNEIRDQDVSRSMPKFGAIPGES